MAIVLSANVASSTQVDLDWDEPYPMATGYDIERDGVVIVQDHPVSSYSDTGLTTGITYNYRVRAVLPAQIFITPPAASSAAVAVVPTVTTPVPATIVNNGHMGGRAPFGSASGVTGWSLTAGNLVVIAFTCRDPRPTPFSLSPSVTGLTQRHVSSNTLGDTFYHYWFTGVVASSGAMTLTVDATSGAGDFWRARIVELTHAQYLASGAGVGTTGVSSFSLGPSSGMSAAGGIAFGTIFSGDSANWDITAPTSLLSDDFDAAGGELHSSIGAETRTSGQTTTVTGTASGGTADFMFGWLQVETV